MEGTKLSYELELKNGAEFEAMLDRLNEKAARLKTALLECENFIEAMDEGGAPARHPVAAELKQSSQILFTVSLGNIDAIMKAPAGAFAPEFMAQLEEMLPRVFNPRPAGHKEPDTTRSGEYKKSKIRKDSIIIGEA